MVYILYHYNPSFVAAVIFICLFTTSTLLHLFQMVRMRTWYFIPFLIGGVFESIGYVGRSISAKQSPNWSTNPYIVQSLLLLLAPAFFAASIYMVLGRIILLTDGEDHSLIRARWLTKVFVTGDVLSFLAQSAGGGILATGKKQSSVDLGQHVITGGLGIQVLFFGCFIAVAGVFHYRIARYPTTRSKSLAIPWERYLRILYLASVLIMIRSVLRIVEYVMGQDGILLAHEIYLYIFDAMLMFIMMVLFNAWHPSKIIHKARADDVAHLESQDIGYALEINNERAFPKH